MVKLRIIYNCDKKVWELFHQDLDEKIASHQNIYELIHAAGQIAELIKPAQVVFVPQSLLTEIVITEFV